MVAPASSASFAQDQIAFDSDRFRLKGVLHRPPVHPRLLVIGSHGLLSNGDSPKLTDLAYRLNLAGIAFFRFDHRGCGTSQGDLEDSARLDNRVRDLQAAAEFLRTRYDFVDRVGLFGSSLGGTSCLAAARYLAPRCLVTLAAPVDSHVLHAANERAAGEFKLPGKLMAGLEFDLREQLPSIGRLLIVHGAQDEVVPLAHARTLYAHCRAPKNLLVLPQADHRLSQPEHQQHFIRAALDWFTDHA